MLRNSLHSHIAFSLNPHYIYQTHYLPSNTSKPIKPIYRSQISQRHSVKSEDKKQYLSLVSKEKKSKNRALLKSNRKDQSKKINSVILGGEKKSNLSIANTYKSLNSSLCRSCINFHQKGGKVDETASIHNATPVQSIFQSHPVNFRHQIPATIWNKNNYQLNQIISQKLDLVNIQPQNNIFLKTTDFNECPKSNLTGRLGGKFIRNTSSAGKIYFSVGNSLEKQQQTTQDKNKLIYTPKFDKVTEYKQKKPRKNAGFIRSASAPKISYDSSPSSSKNQSLTAFYVPSDSNPKQSYITKCIEKMSSIRKYIDELQDFLQDRLQSSYLKNKFMYNPKMCPLTLTNNSIPSKQVSSFSTLNFDSRMKERESLYSPMNSLSLMKTEYNEIKHALNEIKSSSVNEILTSSKQNNFHSQNNRFSYPFSKLQSIYEMKCPISNYNGNIYKQIITQITSRHVKVPRENQYNIFYHKHPINALR